MTRQRRRFSAQTRAKVAVEAIKGQRTVAPAAWNGCAAAA